MSWETKATGGLMPSYTGTIEESWFDTDQNYQNGEVVLLHFRISAIEAPDDYEGKVPDEVVEKFSIGSGWVPQEDGAVVVREDGSDKGFHPSSKYGILIGRINPAGITGPNTRAAKAEAEEYEESFDGLFDVLKERGNPTNARIWEGLRLEFTREEKNYGAGIGIREVLLPSAFVGVDGEGSTTPITNGDSNASEDELVERLTALVGDTGSQAEFVAAALELEGLADNDSLFAQVVDDSDAGFYAQAGS